MLRRILFVCASIAVVSITSFLGKAFAQSELKWVPYDGAVITFDVIRKGKSMGTHQVSFVKTEDGDLVATTDVDLKVKIGPFTAFQYRLDSTEIWKSGRLVSLDGKTNDNGDAAFVSAMRDGETLRVAGSVFQGDIDGDIIPSSHWNIDQVRSNRMLSTETGEVLDMAVTSMGRELIEVSGEEIEANRYLLDSDIDLDLWYGDDGKWLKLTFKARGETIEYRLKNLY